MTRFPRTPPALSFLAGFVAGGMLLTLVLAMTPGPQASSSLALGSGPPPVDVSIAPPTPGRHHRAPLPFPGDPPREATATRSRALDPDSMAMLIDALRARNLALPVLGIDRNDLRDDYHDPRPGGRTHEALDIVAPRGTPVVAVDDGTIASLDPSQGGGGIVIYQYDPAGEFAYYYAHLEGYADGLDEGDEIERGEILGYVGTTGNARPDVPHLHFAIYKTAMGHQWWKGIPLNPFTVLRR